MAIISAIEPVLETLEKFHEQRACQDERVPWPVTVAMAESG